MGAGQAARSVYGSTGLARVVIVMMVVVVIVVVVVVAAVRVLLLRACVWISGPASPIGKLARENVQARYYVDAQISL